ncbi:hypothetical protein IV203_037062 [Nitzschia inconspicua]|uniref:DDE Tnp4 domain-containing protein n=1 Tax=Nitzschia inconspicua TaxID=303405 RepID=A0A9K3LN56_9STRA|nr:hypothetical protein IV203_037062 [Nitzschia inconspicua]
METLTLLPADHKKQSQIAAEFATKSTYGFDNVVAAIDGMLIWITKPSDKLQEKEEELNSVDNFFCRKKQKYGLHLQGTCDANGRFVDVFLGFPASKVKFEDIGRNAWLS